MLAVAVYLLAAVAVAENRTVTVFLPDSDPFPSWQGEVQGIDATATTYLIHCAGPYQTQCAFTPNLTVTQGPTTLAYSYPLGPTGEPFAASNSVKCSLPLNTAESIVCPDMPGYTFTLSGYRNMNPNLVEITSTSWLSGPPTASPTLPDPATGQRAGSTTGGAQGCANGAIFCGGLGGSPSTPAGSVASPAASSAQPTATDGSGASDAFSSSSSESFASAPTESASPTRTTQTTSEALSTASSTSASTTTPTSTAAVSLSASAPASNGAASVRRASKFTPSLALVLVCALGVL